MDITKLTPNTYIGHYDIYSPNINYSYAITGTHSTEPGGIMFGVLFGSPLKLKENRMEDMKPVDCLPESLKIKNIAYCDKPGKEKVILVFKDGSKVIKEMCKGDTFDLKIGVALAFMEKLYGSKTQYHKTIQKKLPQKK